MKLLASGVIFAGGMAKDEIDERCKPVNANGRSPFSVIHGVVRGVKPG